MNKEQLMTEIQKISYAQVIDPNNISIEGMWRIYAGACLVGKNIPADVYIEIKKAFGVGFVESFKLVTDVAGDMPEELACKMFSNIAAEASRFAHIQLKVDGVL
jgi:hypothetical protein